MTDSTQPQDIAGAASGTGQSMPGTGLAAAARDSAQALGGAQWRTLPPAEPWRSPVPPRSAP